MSERSIRREHRRRFATGVTAGAATAVGAFALAPSAQAANFQVDVITDGAPSPCGVGNCTLRDAITLANANGEPDTITFLSSLSGTIRLTAAGGGPLPINDPAPNYPLTIRGPGAQQLEISGDSDDNGTGNYKIFDIYPYTDNVTISGLTLTEGAATAGGAINVAPSYSTLTLNNSRIVNNDSNTEGGGINVQANYTAAELVVNDSTISGNDAGGRGGGISTFGRLTVTNSEISNNTAGGGAGGGGIYQNSKYGVQISNSTITGNGTAAAGGGIHIDSDTKYSGVGRIEDTTISNNTAAQAGAGLQLDDITGADRLTIARSTISGNDGGPSSFGGGVGFNNDVDGTVRFVNSTISGNSASVGGGVSLGVGNGNALVEDGGSIEFNNSTIARNTASGRAGGMYLDVYDTNRSGTVFLNSTLVADNTAAGIRQDLDRANASTSGGFDTAFSLIERRGDAPVIHSPPGSNILGVDPTLGALRNNGGPTLTHRPAGSSKAIDKGDSSRLATDQRGRPRRVDFGVPDERFANGTDIGSVELRRGEVPNAKCAGKLATIIGGSKKIVGTNGPDIISGTSGKNIIRGKGGRDVICGGKGRDRLIGGGGRDRLIGGPGRDIQRQ